MEHDVLEQSVEQPIIDGKHLQRASADPKRIQLEMKRWNRNPEEYIEKNHSRLVGYDFPVFAANNIRIVNEEGRSVTLVFNRIQRRLWDWFLEDMAAGRPIRFFVIKARQMGVSTWTLALFYWLTGSRPNRNALAVTHDEASVNNFNSRFRSIHAQSHPLLKSPTIMDRRDVVHFGTPTAGRQRGEGVGIDSRVIFATAKHGELGRSYNFHAVFLSEFAIWPELKIDIKSQLGALNQTVADLPGTIIIIESTAKGENEATKMWQDPENGYRKIFIPWVAFDKYRRSPKRPLGDLCASDEAGGKSTRYGNEVEEERLIRDALLTWYPEECEAGGESWITEEIQARLNWRRYIIDTKCSGDLHTFRREYPTIAAHAFAATSKNCFDQHSLEKMRRHVELERTGPDAVIPMRFSYNHDPENTDANTKFSLNPGGQLHIYKRPESGQAYVVAGDPGMGIPNSGDPSALVVLAVPDLEEVASFNEIITPDKFAELAYYLGLIYNTALLAIENNERGGYAANLILSKQLHYPRLYWRFDHFDKKAAGKPGVVTSDTNKSVWVTELAKLIRDHEILFRTPDMNEQLQHYVQLPNGEMGGSPGYKDDLVSAAMIAVHLSTKVHMFQAPEAVAPKGSFDWYAKRHQQSRRPGLFGYRR